MSRSRVERDTPWLGLLAATMLGVAVAVPFLPGTFIADSLDQYNQTLLDRYSDWHAPILTALWGFLDTPPGLVLVLFVTMTVVAGVALVRSESPWSWALVSVAVITLWPMTLGWLTTIHKDAWFAAFFLVGAVGSVNARRSVGRARSAWLVLAAAAWWLAASARLNALVPIAAVLMLGWPLVVPSRADARSRRKALGLALLKHAAVAGALTLVILLTQTAWTAHVVQPLQYNPQQAVYQFDLAGMSLSEHRMLLPHSSLKPGATLDDLRAVFASADGWGVYFHPDTPVVYPVQTQEQLDELRDAWETAILDDPGAYVAHRLAFASALFGIGQPTIGVSVPPAYPEDWQMDYRLPDRAFPSLWSRLDQMMQADAWTTHVRPWMFAVFLTGMLISRRGRRSVAVRVLAVGGIASEASIAVAGMSSSFRYSWFLMVCALLAGAIGLWWAVESVRTGANDRRADRAAGL